MPLSPPHPARASPTRAPAADDHGRRLAQSVNTDSPRPHAAAPTDAPRRSILPEARARRHRPAPTTIGASDGNPADTTAARPDRTEGHNQGQPDALWLKYQCNATYLNIRVVDGSNCSALPVLTKFRVSARADERLTCRDMPHGERLTAGVGDRTPAIGEILVRGQTDCPVLPIGLTLI